MDLSHWQMPGSIRPDTGRSMRVHTRARAHTSVRARRRRRCVATCAKRWCSAPTIVPSPVLSHKHKNTQVSAGTAAMLAVGRFAFLPFQRRTQDKSQAVGPKTTGSTYFDSLQQDASFITTTNDPAGFTIIDTLAWGALGRECSFFVLDVYGPFTAETAALARGVCACSTSTLLSHQPPPQTPNPTPSYLSAQTPSASPSWAPPRRASSPACRPEKKEKSETKTTMM